MDNHLRQIDSHQIELYKRIQTFSLEQSNAKLSFSNRLARDNNWSLSYAQRVIEEYKKFTFLAVVAGHPVTPSDQVDQVWHLHLSYTRSYWQDFCPNILQTPLHHDPTRGGSSEHLKFNDWYSRTLDNYQQFFGQIPPADIWPTPQDRFGRDLHFVRVNTQQNWLLPKPSLKSLTKVQHKKSLILCLLFTLISVTGCQMDSNIPNPLNFTGSEFLVFYFWLSTVLIAVLNGLCWYTRISKEDIDQTSLVLDIYETAYLAGGKNRVVDTAIVSLKQKQYLMNPTESWSYSVHQLFIVSIMGHKEDLLHPVEQAVINAIQSDENIRTGVKVRRLAIQEIDMIEDRLCDLGLLVNRNRVWRTRIYQLILIFFLIGLGIAKISVGISREKPVGLLVIELLYVSYFSLRSLLTSIFRNNYSDQYLASLRHEYAGKILTINQDDPKLSLIFALMGFIPPRPKKLSTQSSDKKHKDDGNNSGNYDGDGFEYWNVSSGDSGGSSDVDGGCGGCGGCGSDN